MYRIVLLAATLVITGCSRLDPFKPGSEMFLTQKAATRLHEEFSSVRISPGTKGSRDRSSQLQLQHNPCAGA